MKIQYFLIPFLVVFSAAFLTSCSSSEKIVKNPVDNYTRDLDKYKTYSVLLHDMDLDEKTFSSDVYKHQYKFILPAKDTTGGRVVRDSLSGWVQVTEKNFNKNLDNMGMELLSKNEDGKISKIPSPPGYNNYVGNQRYGSWQRNSSGSSFWAFYGQYAFMSSMLGMASSRPIYRNSYNDYNRNYRGSRPYYGTTTGGKRAYGSGSASSQSMNSKSRFKSNVSSKVSRSGTGSYTRSSGSSSRSSRSSGSSSRSRSSSSGGK